MKVLQAPEIETKTITMRLPKREDAAALFKIFSHQEAIRYWGTPDRTLESSQDRIEKMICEWSDLGFGDWALVDKESKNFVGFCGLHHISGMSEVNLGYLLDPVFWGKGIATEASRAALKFGFENSIMDLVVAVTAPENLGSIRVLEKCGMNYWKPIVRNSRNRVVYSLKKNDWAKQN